MRISEDRYFRDLRLILLAARMLKLEARTRTICTWTGMSRDRIRKLAGSSLPSDRQKPHVRHRGRSPRQTAYFFRSPRIYAHANVLACYFAMVELLPRAPEVIPADAFPSVSRGELLCEAYKFFCPTELLIDFERAILLATALAQRDEVALERCGECGGVMLIDRLAARDINTNRLCQACKLAASATTVCFNPKNSGTSLPMQLSLFDGTDGTGPQRLHDSVADTRPMNAANKNVKSIAVTVAPPEGEATIPIRDVPKPNVDSH
jgi:hypothetical protein